MNGFFDPANGLFDTVNTQFQQLSETTQKIILIYIEATNKIFDQCLTVTDLYVNQLIPTLRSDGTVKYYKKGQKYQGCQDNDLPAVISYRGMNLIIQYYKNYQCYHHRDDDGDHPVIEYYKGIVQYFKNGDYHRDGDLPAIIYPDGGLEYYKNGDYQRDGDLPAVIYSKENIRYYKDGKIHRDGDLPAVILSDGTQLYYKHGIKYTSLR